MINKLLSFLKSDSARTLPRWERFDLDLENRQSIQMLRFLNVELPDTPQVVLIEQVIKSFIEDIQELVYVKDNFSRCKHLMDFKVRLQMEQRLDSIRSQPFFYKTFFYPNGSKSTVESVIPVYYKDPLLNLPLSNWEKEKWSALKPVRIYWTNSREFISNLVPESRPRYKHEQPSVGIVTVDLLLLMMKLFNYIDDRRLEGQTNISIRNFLRDDVFFHQYEDLRELWLIKFIDQILDCEDRSVVDALCKEYHENGFTIADYTPYAMELFHFLQEMKAGAIDPSHLLHAKLLCNKSIIDRTRETQETLDVRDLRQYAHLDLSLHIVNLKLITKFLVHSRNKSLKTSVAYVLERDVRLMKRTRIQVQYRSKTLRAWLLKELDELDFLLNLLKQ